jgi:hypothetical protein
MDTQKRIVSGVLLFCALLVLFFLMRSMYTQRVSAGYIYEPAGISFAYNPDFKVEEKDGANGQKIVTIVPIKTLPIPEAGEAGPVIQCIFTPGVDMIEYVQTISQLIKGTIYPSADIPNVEATGFKTDGLYVSDHVVFEHKDYFIDCSVEYITLDDPLRMNFVTFISNIKLSSE